MPMECSEAQVCHYLCFWAQTESNSNTVLKDTRRSTRCHCADILAYLDDLDHNLTMVECKAGWNNMNIQETMQCLIILERKILRTNTVINRYLLCQEGRNTAMMGENLKLVETVGFVLMVVISLCFVAMAVHDLAKQVAKWYNCKAILIL